MGPQSDAAHVDFLLHLARSSPEDWKLDPVDPEKVRLRGLRALHALYRDPATPSAVKSKIRKFSQQQWDDVLLASPTLEQAAAAMQRLLAGKKHPGPQSNKSRDFEIALEVQERRRGGLTYENAVAAVASEHGLSPERVRNIHSRLNAAAKFASWLRAEQEAFRATLPERWADFLDEQRASDDGMPSGPQSISPVIRGS
jgi:hypothetical protein